MAARTLSGGDLPLTQSEAPRREKVTRTGLKARVRSFRRLPRDLQTARLLLAVKRRLVAFEPGARSRAAQAGNLPLVPPQDPWPGDARKYLIGRITPIMNTPGYPLKMSIEAKYEQRHSLNAVNVPSTCGRVAGGCGPE